MIQNVGISKSKDTRTSEVGQDGYKTTDSGYAQPGLLASSDGEGRTVITREDIYDLARHNPVVKYCLETEPEWEQGLMAAVIMLAKENNHLFERYAQLKTGLVLEPARDV